nr:melanization protease 1-like isoform X2 [Aedes albopictus]XP_019551985.2 melanization protease 1-like isoform X2 [Aedes albopictus]
MKLTTCLFLCCILEMSRWTYSKSMCNLEGECTATNGHQGKFVLITSCPALLKIAMSPTISLKQKKHLEAHTCGDHVCCEAPMILTTAPSTTASRSIPESDYEDMTTTDIIPSNKMSASDNDKSFQPSSLLPKEYDCGLEPASVRIFGGNVTQKDQFRWTVALDYNTYKKKGVLCGGSLINTRYVLTAAHCVDKVQEKDLTVRLGEWDLDQNPDCEKDDPKDCNPEVIFANVNRIIIHPEYKRKDKMNDIALIRMEQPLSENYTKHILPICMPISTDLILNSFTNKNVSVVGWGSAENVTTSQYKMYAEITTTTNERYKYITGKPIEDNQMAAQCSPEAYRDSCTGDSGGPLQIQINGTYYLIGIISHGPRCGASTIPAVYTRVTSYMEWILESIKQYM